MKKTAMASAGWMLSLLLVLAQFTEATREGFDVRQHLSTVSRYGAVKDVVVNSTFVPSNAVDGCTPIHLNLVARHGTRSPTKKRMRELDRLASHLKELISHAEQKKLSLEKLPAWLRSWESPWKGKLRGGELISQGEEELYGLGMRMRERFPQLFEEPYHPDVYVIKATQVPRASASAVAFGMGLLIGKGSIGPAKHKAFAVTSESRASDLMLRFFDSCQSYKVYRQNKEPTVAELKEPVLDKITAELVSRYGLDFTRQDTASLWFLCKQEASLLDVTNQACGLFNPSEVELLEWTDDLEVFMLKGYGNSINYKMGVPLLEDIVQSMEQAIKSHEEKLPLGSYEKARLRFAHAETVVPFSCLLGLFLEGSVIEIDLSSKLLHRTISPSIGNLSSLQVLRLGNNSFSGEIPPGFGNLASLRILNLHSNLIAGDIPANIANCSNLVGLGLGRNRLVGKIPDSFGGFRKLRVLNLDFNDLTGSIPSSLDNVWSLDFTEVGDGGGGSVLHFTEERVFFFGRSVSHVSQKLTALTESDGN